MSVTEARRTRFHSVLETTHAMRERSFGKITTRHAQRTILTELYVTRYTDVPHCPPGSMSQTRGIGSRVAHSSTSIEAACEELVPVGPRGPPVVTNSLKVRFQIAPASNWP